MKRLLPTLLPQSSAAALAALACLVLAVGHGHAQDLPAASADYGAFAFPSQDGRRLLANSAFARPDTLQTAICSGGRRLPVLFNGTQKEGANTTGRQAPSNFNNAAGSVVAITEGSVRSDDSCFLPAPGFLADSVLLTVRDAPVRPACSPADVQRYTASRQRPITHCWRVANMEAGGSIGLIEFALQEKNALASVVFDDGRRLIFQDYPAELKEPGGDLWRVDDGGVLSPQPFQVLFVMRRATEIVLGVLWAGAEGENLSLSISESDRFTRVLQDYWYRSPV